ITCEQIKAYKPICFYVFINLVLQPVQHSYLFLLTFAFLFAVVFFRNQSASADFHGWTVLGSPNVFVSDGSGGTSQDTTVLKGVSADSKYDSCSTWYTSYYFSCNYHTVINHF